MLRLDLVDAHLSRAVGEADPYASFDSAWKAFNVLYEAEHAAGQGNTERDLIARAVRRLAPIAATLLDRAPNLDAFVTLDPVFDEKIWARSGTKDRSKHNLVRKRLAKRAVGAGTTEDVQALVDALYVVRCNLVHGFKTPNGPRDHEVLASAAPLIIEIAEAVRSTWLSDRA